MELKPKYSVPSMSEIEKIPWNGFNVVSTFSGTGGSCLGYRLAGFRVLWASEFIESAQESYKSNHPNSILDCRDIRKVKAIDIRNAIQGREIDILDGSPPCSAFSTAGKREKGWGDVKRYSDSSQRVDDLFFEYARLVSDLQPKVFIAENVSGLVKGKAKGYFKMILQRLKLCGYNVRCKVLDAQWLGVPQRRKRTIFIGVRHDLKLMPVYPDPLPYYYSVTEALDSVSETVEPDTDISEYAIGKEWDRIPIGGQSKKYMSLVKPYLNRPCPCVTQTGGVRSAASVVHPTEKRKFSIAELKRICGFPDDFKLAGSFTQKYERLGRAVPPVMMSHIASTVRDKVLSKC